MQAFQCCDDCQKEATVRGVAFEEKDVGSDNHCNILATKTTEYRLNENKMAFEQAKAFCEGKGGRLATRSEVLDAMAYLPDEGDSWTPVSGVQATIGCNQQRLAVRRHARRTQQRCLRAPIMGVGRDHGARF